MRSRSFLAVNAEIFVRSLTPLLARLSDISSRVSRGANPNGERAVLSLQRPAAEQRSHSTRKLCTAMCFEPVDGICLRAGVDSTGRSRMTSEGVLQLFSPPFLPPCRGPVSAALRLRAKAHAGRRQQRSRSCIVCRPSTPSATSDYSSCAAFRSNSSSARVVESLTV